MLGSRAFIPEEETVQIIIDNLAAENPAVRTFLSGAVSGAQLKQMVALHRGRSSEAESGCTRSKEESGSSSGCPTGDVFKLLGLIWYDANAYHTCWGALTPT